MRITLQSKSLGNKLGYVLACLIALHYLIDVSATETLFNFSGNNDCSTIAGLTDDRLQQNNIEIMDFKVEDSKNNTPLKCQNNCCCHLFFSYSDSMNIVEKITQTPDYQRLEQVERIHFSFFRPPIV